MFDDFLIASTAVSSFNNAALINPFFFAIGLLSLPLFFMVYLYGHDFASRFGWTNQNAEHKTSFWSAAFLAMFIMLFGGNYAVIRGGISLLPLLLAVVLFALMMVVSNGFVRFKYVEKTYNKKSRWIFLGLLLISAIFSGMMTWWGMLLQISAIICGTIVGCRLKSNTSWVMLTTFIYGVMTVLVLMQPEYFRFGQLGHLTIVHLMGILLAGFFAVTTLVSRYIKAHGKIRQSAYIKLKWLFRIISILALILFVSTESVPVFLGLLIALVFLESLSIYHSQKSVDGMYKQSWALLIFVLGLLIVCPVISATGLIYLLFNPKKFKLLDFLRLL